jgi:hypothetical protein
VVKKQMITNKILKKCLPVLMLNYHKKNGNKKEEKSVKQLCKNGLMLLKLFWKWWYFIFHHQRWLKNTE